MSSLNQASPAIVTREIDLTNRVAAEGSTGGAMVGQFAWGPVEEYVTVANENQLANIFMKPNDDNFVSWFTAANFLSYASELKVVRIIDENALNASDDTNGLLVKNATHQQIVDSTNPGVSFVARCPGELGNGLTISLCDSKGFASWKYKDEFDFAPGTSDSASDVGASNDELHIVVIDTLGNFTGIPGDILEKFAFVSKAKDAKDANSAPNYYVNVLNNSSRYVWAFDPIGGADVSNVLSGGDSVEDVDIDTAGSGYTTAPSVTFSTPGSGGVRAEGTATINVGTGEVTGVTVTNPGSGYASAPTVTFTGGGGSGAGATANLTAEVQNDGVDWGKALMVAGVPSEYSSLVNPLGVSISGGVDSSAIGAQEIQVGLDMFQNAEEVDVSMIILGDAGGETDHDQIVQYAIQNIAEERKDCIVFFSPTLNDVLNRTQVEAVKAVIDRRNSINSTSSYAVMDSGWKLTYDVYNDKYRWIPLNSDIAGITARVDVTNDPWWSPGGYNRGVLKNVVSLAFSPKKSSRDQIYKLGINPVVTFTGQGTILYGDRTLKGKGSAFSQIGIRRLFITLEESISKAAKRFLFEFNDNFTRAQFRSMVEPFLREVKGRRGLDDFKVICDETNNTPDVIMRGEFIGSIFVKPQYSIQWITLNFVAVRRDVSFEEVAGGI